MSPAPGVVRAAGRVAGWPVSYLADYHGLSVVGRVGLVGALLGEDLFDAVAFGLNVLAWLALLAGARWLGRHLPLPGAAERTAEAAGRRGPDDS